MKKKKKKNGDMEYIPKSSLPLNELDKTNKILHSTNGNSEVESMCSENNIKWPVKEQAIVN